MKRNERGDVVYAIKRELDSEHICYGCSVRGRLDCVRTEEATPTRKAAWEYKVDNSLSEEQLNQLGSEGWELVAVGVSNVNQSTLYLKRAK